MRLVVTYEVTDGYTFSVRTHDPIEFDSIDALYYYLIEVAELYMKDNISEEERRMVGKKIYDDIGLDICDFIGHNHDGTMYFQEPLILTLEDWFDRYQVTKE